MADWAAVALCRLESNYKANFFPERSNSTGIQEAKAVCRRCPVKNLCLEEGLEGRLPNGNRLDGVWGGTTESEREILRVWLSGRSYRDAYQSFGGQTS